jgi:predicted TIM-barrel fold metal-dependent hydrolase
MSYQKINEKVIDSHLHVFEYEDKDGMSFIEGFDEYIENMGVEAINIASLPSGKGRDVSNNIMIAFYKLAHPKAFAHGGLVYHEYPAPDKMPEGMDFVTQYKELMEIGFDGIKMLEGKPTLHKRVGHDLSDSLFDPFFAEMEKDGTHLIFHVNDPEEFWDKNADQWIKDAGWYYGDGGFASNEEVYRQMERILEKHPNLCVNFAHFFFYSKRPEKLVELFNKHPNMGVDITPGGEMYIAFDENREYYRDFFIKYSDRIQFGTDSCFPYGTESYSWLTDRVYRYIATDEEFKGFADRIHTGMKLPKEVCENILYKNFERTVGTKPKEINKEALRKYIEKYKHLIPEERLSKVVELAKKYL